MAGLRTVPLPRGKRHVGDGFEDRPHDRGEEGTALGRPEAHTAAEVLVEGEGYGFRFHGFVLSVVGLAPVFCEALLVIVLRAVVIICNFL